VTDRRLPTISLGATANTRFGGPAGAAWLDDDALYEGVLLRRSVAGLIDGFLVSCLVMLAAMASCAATIVTLGLLSLPAFLLAAPVIHIALAAATIGGSRDATPGMRVMGLRVATWAGGKPDYFQALLMPAMFYGTILPTGFFILAFAFFNRRSRCLHDFLAGVVVVREDRS
jgi:uncharacterized RDD family membrane protein YckC